MFAVYVMGFVWLRFCFACLCWCVWYQLFCVLRVVLFVACGVVWCVYVLLFRPVSVTVYVYGFVSVYIVCTFPLPFTFPCCIVSACLALVCDVCSVECWSFCVLLCCCVLCGGVRCCACVGVCCVLLWFV